MEAVLAHWSPDGKQVMLARGTQLREPSYDHV
jgi:hypothetical protein